MGEGIVGRIILDLVLDGEEKSLELLWHFNIEDRQYIVLVPESDDEEMEIYVFSYEGSLVDYVFGNPNDFKVFPVSDETDDTESIQAIIDGKIANLKQNLDELEGEGS